VRLILVVILSAVSLIEIVRVPLEAIEGAMVELSCEDEPQNKEIEDRVTDLVSGIYFFWTSFGLSLAPILSTRIYSRYGLSKVVDFAAFFHLALFVAYLVFGGGIQVLQNPWIDAKEVKEEPAPELDLENEEEREALLSF